METAWPILRSVSCTSDFIDECMVFIPPARLSAWLTPRSLGINLNTSTQFTQMVIAMASRSIHQSSLLGFVLKMRAHCWNSWWEGFDEMLTRERVIIVVPSLMVIRRLLCRCILRDMKRKMPRSSRAFRIGLG